MPQLEQHWLLGLGESLSLLAAHLKEYLLNDSRIVERRRGDQPQQ
jgi:hypothetical protein